MGSIAMAAVDVVFCDLYGHCESFHCLNATAQMVLDRGRDQTAVADANDKKTNGGAVDRGELASGGVMHMLLLLERW